jgi:hypothetical protein
MLSLVLSVAGASWASTAFLSDSESPGGWFVVAAVGALMASILAFIVFIWLLMEAIRLGYVARSEVAAENNWKRESEELPSL